MTVQIKKSDSSAGNFIRSSSINSSLLSVSIVIPTKNRKNTLKACLHSLFNMDYPISLMEIIVVDGGSIDGTTELIKKEFKSVKVLVDKRNGISYARNTGGKAAKGDIIAFTDDDCIADKYWLINLVKSFQKNKIEVAGGPVYLLKKEIFPKKLVESLTLGLFSLEDKEQTTDLLITANFAIRREVFEFTKFDERFGRRDTLLFKWEEDVEFSQRLRSLGYDLFYIPEAKIYHNISIKRIDMKYIIKKEFFGGLSHYMIERKAHSRFQITVNSLRSVVGAAIIFFRKRSIARFCWLIKNCAILIAVFFIPFK